MFKKAPEKYTWASMLGIQAEYFKNANTDINVPFQ